jgi:hypothetical protein
MLPPARTRDVALGPAPARGLNLLAPVLSGLFGRDAPAREAPPVEPVERTIGESLVVTGIEGGTFAVDEETGDVEIVAEEVTIELDGIPDFEIDDDTDEALTIDVDSPDLDLDEAEEATAETAFGALAPDIDEQEPETAVQWYGDDRSAPWERTDGLEEAGEAGAPAGDEAAEIWLAEADAAEDELVLEADDADDANAGAETEMRQAPPPLSPWDLGAASISGEAGERAARARVEWESLGQALSESLTGASPQPEQPGPHGYDLTDERAAELDSDGKSPFGGPVIPVGASGTAESPVSELVRRLEAFAARLRDEGPGALTRAQTGDDRFDALLASIAAGFLAGRGE